jgi:hypothetical protein
MHRPTNRLYHTRGMCVGDTAARSRVRPVAATGSTIAIVGRPAAATSTEISNSAVHALAASSATGER